MLVESGASHQELQWDEPRPQYVSMSVLLLTYLSRCSSPGAPA